jgi:phage/plasmid-like protein (TIGR03299 family)
MAHELDTRSNGVAAMFSVRETPWHELGTLLSNAPTFAEAMTLGGLDFDVELHPMRASINGVMVDVPDNRAVVRMDRNDVLGVVGPSYHVLQNADAFRVLEPLVDSGVATIETGGTLRGGRDVWMMAKFNVDDAKVRSVLGDEVQPYALISNNHNGARKVTLQETPIRVVCANTLGFALNRIDGRRKLDKAITVRHTTNVGQYVVDAAADLFSSLVDRYRAIADQYQALKTVALSEALFAKHVLDVLTPLPDAPKSERKDNIAKAAFERATERAQVRRDRLTTLWTEGDGHQGDHSAWEAYNAATQSLDHDADLWKAGNRLESLFDGSLAKQKQDVIESLMEVVTLSAN